MMHKPHHVSQTRSSHLVILLKRHVTISGAKACGYTARFWWISHVLLRITRVWRSRTYITLRFEPVRYSTQAILW